MVALTLGITSCEKYLNHKTNLKIVIPDRLDDLQALLDAVIYINYGYYPGLIEEGADDIYISQTSFNTLIEFDRDIYLWKDYPLHQNAQINYSWMWPHRNLLMANTVLDEIGSIETSEITRRDQIKGAAHFYRAYLFFQMAQVYCDQYVPGGKNSNLGFPMRLTSDFNEPTVRASVEQTYRQIIDDLQKALELLPENSIVPTRPNKISAAAALSKVYLIMGDFPTALRYAQQVLKSKYDLLDYNLLNANADIPIPIFNDEVIYYAFNGSGNIISRSDLLVDSTLITYYAENDLRKQVYLIDNKNGSYGFKGSYTGRNNKSIFIGITVSEIILIEAECLARANQVDLALASLNRLLAKRYKEGTFIPYSGLDQESCMDLILKERRKELLLRGVRWSDLKRLNREPKYAKTLRRDMIIDGVNQTFVLPPNDPRYNHIIPEIVIQKSKIQQNPR